MCLIHFSELIHLSDSLNRSNESSCWNESIMKILNDSESVCGVLRIILCSEIKYALNVLDLPVFVFLVVVFNESV